MSRFRGILLACGAAVSLASAATAQKSGLFPVADAATVSGAAGEGLGTYGMRSIPRGTSTVIGGVIRDVDPVRDRFTLRAFGGGKPMRILFDERTEVYRDGVRMRLTDLRSEDHASVETVLDGTDVFAISVHTLSQAAEGECRGRVLGFDPSTGVLTVSDALTHGSVKLRVTPDTSLLRIGQEAGASSGPTSADLVDGTLIDASFQPDRKGNGVASHIDILAVPGTPFQFVGEVSYIDLHAGVMVVVDPRDEKSYKIGFDAASLPVGKQLHEGQHVRVTATFDGERYLASAMNVF